MSTESLEVVVDRLIEQGEIHPDARDAAIDELRIQVNDQARSVVSKLASNGVRAAAASRTVTG